MGKYEVRIPESRNLVFGMFDLRVVSDNSMAGSPIKSALVRSHKSVGLYPKIKHHMRGDLFKIY